MTDIQKYASSLDKLSRLSLADNKPLDFSDMALAPLSKDDLPDYRFFCLNEISEGKAEQYRLAMANVISGLCTSNSSIVYLLSGTPNGIKLYIGVAGQNNISEVGKMLKSSFEGNFLGAQLKPVYQDDTALTDIFKNTKHMGLVTGVPSYNSDENHLDGEDFQGIERLVNTLSDTTWQMLIVAEPGSEQDIYASLDQVYELSTALSSQIKHSIQQSENSGYSTTETQGTSDSHTQGTSSGDSRGTTKSVSDGQGGSKGTSSSGGGSNSGTNWNKGTSDSTSTTHNTGSNTSDTKGSSYAKAEGLSGGKSVTLSRERIDKRIEQIQEHLNETQINRFRQGLSKGMFRTAVYVCAENQATYDRLSRGVLSIFQGSQPAFTPLTVSKLHLKQAPKLVDLLKVRAYPAAKFIQNELGTAVVHSIPQYTPSDMAAATWLNTRELALIAGLPCLELPGLKLRKSVSFALNTADTALGDTLKLGHIMQDGRCLEGKTVELAVKDLNKHIFVTGVTGSGKTTTCMKLLLESGLPFTVIEPAKTEYRALYGQVENIQYYSLGREDLTTFRLNPFELVSKYQNLTGHISMLKATMAAVFPMEASMPFIVEQAIIQAYQHKGWDIAANINYLTDDPWNSESNAWPTFSDMIRELDNVINSAGMGKEFEEKYRGSLVSRLNSLTSGIKGTMIDTPRSINFDSLLDQKIVIELDELKDEEDKAFFMGLIISRLAECMKQRHRSHPEFLHMTLVEEAHRLLSRPEPGADGSKKLGVEMFANLLAEVRKYGESLIIADQIPNKLVVDVIKNTNTKIIHRLFAADDRNTIGDAMGLNDEQKDFLPLLKAGETVIYSGGWHAPVRAQIDQLADTTAPEIPEEQIKVCGIQQLWANRAVLFPQLSHSHDWQSPETFAQFVQGGRQAINMLVAFAKHLSSTSNSSHVAELPPVAHALAERLSQHLGKLEQSFEIERSKQHEMLAVLFVDSDSIWASTSAEKAAKYRKTLLNVLAELTQSGQAMIEHLGKDKTDRTYTESFIAKANPI